MAKNSSNAGILDQMNKQFEVINKRFDSVESRITSVQVDIRSLKEDNKSIHAELSDFKNKSYSHFDAIYNKLDRFGKDEYYSLTAGLKRIEDEHKIIDHETIYKEIQSLKNRN